MSFVSNMRGEIIGSVIERGGQFVALSIDNDERGSFPTHAAARAALLPKGDNAEDAFLRWREEALGRPEKRRADYGKKRGQMRRG